MEKETQIIELENRIRTLEEKLSNLTDTYFRNHYIDKDVFPNNVYFNNVINIQDGGSIIPGSTSGLNIGTLTSQKIGFFGKTPVIQQSTILDPSGGATIDSQARTAINSIIDALQAFGFIA